MIPEPNPRLESALSKFSKVASAGVALAGAAVVIGWWLDTVLLKSVFPGIVSMKANTAITFVCLGFALEMLLREQPKPYQLHIGRAGAAFAVRERRE